MLSEVRILQRVAFLGLVLLGAGCDENKEDETEESDTSTRLTSESDRIAFVSDKDGNPEIYVMDERGLTRLTEHPARDVAPSWSPDGTQIAFISDRNGEADIYVMNGDGGYIVQVTRQGVDELPPAWSPDGRRIAFSGDGGICIMNADGSNIMRVVTGGYPSWFSAIRQQPKTTPEKDDGPLDPRVRRGR